MGVFQTHFLALSVITVLWSILLFGLTCVKFFEFLEETPETYDICDLLKSTSKR